MRASRPPRNGLGSDASRSPMATTDRFAKPDESLGAMAASGLSFFIRSLTPPHSLAVDGRFRSPGMRSRTSSFGHPALGDFRDVTPHSLDSVGALAVTRGKGGAAVEGVLVLKNPMEREAGGLRLRQTHHVIYT